MRTTVACIASWIALSLVTWMTLRFSWLLLLSCALSIGVLCVVAKASEARGWALFRLLVALYAGIGVFNIQFEALIFKIVPPLEILRATAIGLGEVVAISALFAWAITRDDPRPASPSDHVLIASLCVRLGVIAFAYVVLFMIAGALIWPFVRQFYATSGMVTFPSFGVIVGTELVRGLVFGAALIPLFRRMEGRRLQAGLVAALTLAVVPGLAPLLLPVDDVFPFEIRRFHMLEIVGANVVLGSIAAYLLVRRRPDVRTDSVVAPA